MSRHSHRRRHHGRNARLLQWLVLGSFFVVGLGVLAAVFLFSPVGLTLLIAAAVVPALFALAVVSCVVGRLAAVITNAFRLSWAYARLEKFMHEAHESRQTREVHSRRLA